MPKHAASGQDIDFGGEWHGEGQGLLDSRRGRACQRARVRLCCAARRDPPQLLRGLDRGLRPPHGNFESVRNVSPRWICRWKQDSLISLGKDMGPEKDEEEYDQDRAAFLVKQFFRAQLVRRLDGPVRDGKNAILRHVKDLAAKEGLDLGSVDN